MAKITQIATTASTEVVSLMEEADEVSSIYSGVCY